MKRRFIVTADDYGVTPIIDMAIEEAVRQGIVTSVACFANGTDHKDDFSMKNAIALKKKYPHVAIGCHFTITSGKRVSNNQSSLGQKGDPKYFRMATSQHSERATDVELIEELQAQVDQFVNAGLEIEHFSDHMGILSYSKKGLSALISVISAYSKSINKEVPMRKPVFISCVKGMKNDCLESSDLVKKAGLGLVFRNTGLKVTNLFRKGAWQSLKLNSRSLNASLKKIHEAEIPTTDYFIESFYANSSWKTLQCIQRNVPGKRYHLHEKKSGISGPLIPRVVTAELMVHLAVAPDVDMGKDAYDKAIEDLKTHGGVSIGYLKKKRVEEFNMLKCYFEQSFAKSELGGFNR